MERTYSSDKTVVNVRNDGVTFFPKAYHEELSDQNTDTILSDLDGYRDRADWRRMEENAYEDIDCGLFDVKLKIESIARVPTYANKETQTEPLSTWINRFAYAYMKEKATLIIEKELDGQIQPKKLFKLEKENRNLKKLHSRLMNQLTSTSSTYETNTVAKDEDNKMNVKNGDVATYIKSEVAISNPTRPKAKNINVVSKAPVKRKVPADEQCNNVYTINRSIIKPEVIEQRKAKVTKDSQNTLTPPKSSWKLKHSNFAVDFKSSSDLQPRPEVKCVSEAEQKIHNSKNNHFNSPCNYTKYANHTGSSVKHAKKDFDNPITYGPQMRYPNNSTNYGCYETDIGYKNKPSYGTKSLDNQTMRSHPTAGAAANPVLQNDSNVNYQSAIVYDTPTEVCVVPENPRSMVTNNETATYGEPEYVVGRQYSVSLNNGGIHPVTQHETKFSLNYSSPAKGTSGSDFDKQKTRLQQLIEEQHLSSMSYIRMMENMSGNYSRNNLSGNHPRNNYIENMLSLHQQYLQRLHQQQTSQIYPRSQLPAQNFRNDVYSTEHNPYFPFNSAHAQITPPPSPMSSPNVNNYYNYYYHT